MSASNQREEAIFAQAMEANSVEAALEIVRDKAVEDELRERLARLVRRHFQSGGLLDSPVVGFDPTMLLESEVEDATGTQIGPYKLLQQIGEGGMGAVYMAEQTKPVQRRVAVKIIKPGMDTRQVIARFEAERQALAMMDHPNIAKVLDAGTTDQGRPYFVMELVKGIPITQFCDSQHLTPRERLELFIPVCQAVQHAHQKGIIHRDLKPSNILVALYDGRSVPKVIDFGVAKATSGSLTDKTMFTQMGQVVGTLEYMSPEQAHFNQLDVDTRTDIYSLGTILYEILTGTTPFTRQRLRSVALDEVMRIIRDEDPPSPSTRVSTTENIASIAASRHVEPKKLNSIIKGDLDWVVMKSLEKDRARRYESANGLATDIRRFLDNEPVAACPPSNAYRLKKFASKNRGLLSAAATIAVILLAASIISTWQAFKTAQQRDRAVSAEQETSRALANETVALKEESAARAAAQKAKQLAENQARTIQKRLIDSFVDRGMRLVDEGHSMRSLPWLVEAFRLDEPNRELIHRTRIAMVRSGIPILSNLFVVSNPPEQMQIFPDEKWLLLFGDDSAAVVDATTGRTRWSSPDGEFVRAAVLSPDGNLLLIGHQHESQILEVQNNFRERFKIEYESPIDTASFSHDSKQLVTANGQLVRIWNSEDGQQIGESMQHNLPVKQVEFSPDGNYLLTVARKQPGKNESIPALIWDARTGMRKQNFEVLFASQAAFTPNSKKIAVGRLGGSAGIWNIESGKPTIRNLEHAGKITQIRFSPKGRYLLTASNSGTVRIWDSETGNLVCPPAIHEGAITDAIFNSTGSQFATASEDGTARVWNTISGEAESAWLEHSGNVHQLRFMKDDRRLVSAAATGAIRTWDLAGGVPPHSRICVAFGNNLAYSPDGSKLAVANVSNMWNARVWNLEPVNPATAPIGINPGGPGGAFLVRYSPGGTHVGICTLFNEAYICNVITGKRVATLKHPTNIIGDINFSPDGSQVVTVANRSKAAFLWDVATGEQLARIDHGGFLGAADFNATGDKIYTSGFDSKVKIWNLADKTHLTLGHATRGRILCKWHPSQDLVLTAIENSAQVWNAITGSQVVTGMEHGGPIADVAFDSDGQRILTISVDQTGRTWDASNGKPLIAPFNHGNAGLKSGPRGEFSADGNFIVTCGSTRSALIWDAATGHPVSPTILHPDIVGFATFRPDSRQIATTCLDIIPRVWNMPSDSRSVTELGDFAALYASYTIDPSAGQTPLGPDEVQDSFTQLRNKYPTDFQCTDAQRIDWHRHRIESLLKRSQGQTRDPFFDETDQHLAEVLRLVPDDNHSRHLRADALAVEGEHDKALIEFQEILERDPHANLVEQAAWLAIQLGELNTYRQFCRAAHARYKAGLENMIEVAWLYSFTDGHDSREIDQIIDMVTLCLESKPDDFLNYVAGALHYRTGQFEKAIEFLETSQDARQRDVPALIAMAFARAGNGDKAQAALEKAQQFRESDLFTSQLNWHNRLEIKLLLEEAQRVIADSVTKEAESNDGL